MKHITLRTHEVQQILAGRQTRLSRPVKPQPEAIRGHHVAGYSTDPDIPWPADYGFGVLFSSAQYGLTEAVKCPWKVGDIIACKETYQYIDFMGEDNGYVFKESQNGRDWEENSEGWTWRSPVTIPTAACRLYLRIKELHCEKIQDITEEGAKAEVEEINGQYKNYWGSADRLPTWIHARQSYKTLHQSIYGPESWDLNPWHWILIFEKTDKP